MTLQQLRYFLEACRAGSFTGAADALYVAQSSIAQQVRLLEQEIGMRLFVRTGRGLQLTEAGMAMRTNAELVMVALQKAETSMRGRRQLQGGTASLGTFGLAQSYLVSDVVSSFISRNPEVTVRVVGQHSSEVVDQVRRGKLEAGLVTLPVEENSLIVEPVVTDDLVYAALPGPDTERPMTIRRMAEIRLIAWPAVAGWSDSIRRQFKQWATEEGLELRAAVEVERMESAFDLAALGLGGTYALRTITESNIFPEALDTTPFERPLYETYAFIRRRDHRLSPASEELVRLAREQMESYRRDPEQ